MELIIGNKNYSSWSLRGWLMLKAFELPFEETQLSLFSTAFYQRLSDLNTANKVPVLVDGENRIWDSLAICEYVNETKLDGRGWPADTQLRAEARSVACEMHSGFSGLRNEMPMNCRARRQVELSAEAQKDIQRIDQLWSELTGRCAEDGPWLFGTYSIADVMFAPVVLRFVTYGVEVSEASQRYMESVLSHPALKAWLEEALKETEIVEEDEAGVPI